MNSRILDITFVLLGILLLFKSVITPVNSVTKANPILSHLFASGGAGHSVDGSENPLVALSLNQ
jgi:hypothetical protein